MIEPQTKIVLTDSKGKSGMAPPVEAAFQLTVFLDEAPDYADLGRRVGTSKTTGKKGPTSETRERRATDELFGGEPGVAFAKRSSEGRRRWLSGG